MKLIAWQFIQKSTQVRNLIDTGIDTIIVSIFESMDALNVRLSVVLNRTLPVRGYCIPRVESSACEKNKLNVTNDGVSATLNMLVFMCLLQGFRGKQRKREKSCTCRLLTF